MNLKFSGTFAELKEKLTTVGGEWDDTQLNKKVLRKDSGVLNWFESTGTIHFQGKDPDKSQLEATVSHLLYPDEYEKPGATSDAEVIAAQPVAKAEARVGIEHEYLTTGFRDTELVVGFVNAVGTEYKRVIEPLKDRLQGFGYKVEEIRVSSLLQAPKGTQSEYQRIKHYMEQGDQLRDNAKNNAILAAGVVAEIKKKRTGNPSKTAYIVNSLKHPDEVEFLRKVYADGFFLIGIHADEKRRHGYLVNDKSMNQQQASELIKTDEDENLSHGQRTRDTYHLADFFINLGKNDDQVKNTIQRFLELIFSNPYRNPTFDEFAMFMAFNSSIRSSDLSRQVGAIMARNRQIIATGANDCPQFGGGQYWAEVDPETGEVKDAPDGKDYTREEDSNKGAQQEIISEIADALIEGSISKADNKDAIKAILKKSKISDLTEFGRVVHAEMEAILSCAREGISTVDSTLYCTTFPCHNCAKHIVDAGIKRVVYVEPYPKSRALDLHSDSIVLKTSADANHNDRFVTFEPFTGVGARRFLALFSMSLGAGIKVKRKDGEGKSLKWDKGTACARTPLLPKSYLDIENAAANIWGQAKVQQ